MSYLQRLFSTRSKDILSEDLLREQHAMKAMQKWKKISLYFAFPIVGLFGTYTLYHELHKEHEEKVTPSYSYLRIRSKVIRAHLYSHHPFNSKGLLLVLRNFLGETETLLSSTIYVIKLILLHNKDDLIEFNSRSSFAFETLSSIPSFSTSFGIPEKKTLTHKNYVHLFVNRYSIYSNLHKIPVSPFQNGNIENKHTSDPVSKNT
jgi:hypothetical protein